ncbi:MAG: hypothetical protein KGS72_27940 [Cyanobacteria bacterium REEB67]|nr:hypothetical protein [Cyanobacteria bacterium REEB67]
MDIFQYFEEEHKYIEERLSELEHNYKDWSAERVFVRATKMIDAITKHFDKQETLVLDEVKRYKELENVISDCLIDRKHILAAIDDLLMDHIDSQEFRGNLGKLLQAVRQHISFSDEKLYQAIRSVVPASKLAELNEAVKTRMFG